MLKVEYPDRSEWKQLLDRPKTDPTLLFNTVREVMDSVRSRGDEALREYTLKFDKAAVEQFRVSEEEFAEAFEMMDDSLLRSIEVAVSNITSFHEAQAVPPLRMEKTPGIRLQRKSCPIDKVGLYIPGGSAPLFSTVLMLGIPARLAGCGRIVLCTPPSAQGKVHPAVLTAARKVGVTEVYKVGGIQAIAAMTFGTQSVPAVSKIFGPGNQWVMAAKQMASTFGVAIDMPAGPSEVLVMADSTAHPDFIAADLLSQAEHGPDSQVILLTDDKNLIPLVEAELERQTALLPRRDIVAKALGNSRIILLEDVRQMLEMSNLYAPEHLIIEMDTAETVAEGVTDAGSVFIGHYSPESAGDYASGTNHSLPTCGYAKAYSGVSLDSFVKRITFQSLTQEGIRSLEPAISRMAEAESLDAHRNAAMIRVGKLCSK